MREKIRDKERLEHIRDAINRIQNHMPVPSKDNLQKDGLVYYGIVKNIEIMGEAAYKLSLDFKSTHPQTEWDDIEGMRHVLVHEYYQIQPERVLHVVENDLPLLKEQIIRYLSEME
ncbi:MAG: DUF86 domain-containing protein [Bacteroidales bacterium]|nr:DUF86 domain-containing protein [Bacteroidales bacterium]